MAYILGDQRHGDPAEAHRLWNAYRAYVRDNEARFPPGAHQLASSEWYFMFSDHRAPHDAWLESFHLREVGVGARRAERHLSLTIRLLGAYHDRILEFHYPEVFGYEIEKPTAPGGQWDWRYDEFRLSEAGHLIHEIEWAGGAGYAARWLIVASDVEFSEHPHDAAV